MRKGRLAVVTVFGSLAVGLAACTVLSGRVYNSVFVRYCSMACYGDGLCNTDGIVRKTGNTKT